MGITTMVQHNMEVSESNPTSKPSFNKFRIARVEEFDFCTAFLGGVLGNKTCGLMKGVDGSCKIYKTHAVKEKIDLGSALYLTSNGINMFLKPLVSITI